MDRPAKTAAKSKWITYAAHLESADDAGKLQADIAHLRNQLEAKTRSIKQLQRQIRRIG